MKRVLDWFKNLSLKWRLTILFFVFSMFPFGIWVAYDLVTVIDVFVFNISDEIYSFIWMSIFFLYCAIAGYIIELLFKKFNLKINFKKMLLIIFIFIIFNYVLFELLNFLDLYFNGSGHLIFD